MHKGRPFYCLAAICLALVPSFAAGSPTHTWDNGGGDGLWSTAANWDPDGVPVANDVVIFDTVKTSCVADAVSNNLASITLTANYTGTVTFATNFVNGNNELTLNGDLTVNNGTILCKGNPDSGAGGSGIVVNAANILVGTNGIISANYQGFTNNVGPGAGTTMDIAGGGGGGGYGGRGGPGSTASAIGGATYGLATGPTSLGSGGAGGTGVVTRAGYGGGAIKLAATGTVTVNGKITANGESGVSDVRAGGGSGGSIWIVCDTIAGTGTISANGGNASGGGASKGGGGGGGRIQITWNNNSFSGTVSANAGVGGGEGGRAGHLGTYSFPDNVSMIVSSNFALAPGTYNIPDLVVSNNSTLGVQGDTNTTEGSGVIINCSNLTVLSGSSISGTGEGFETQAGPGQGLTVNASSGGGGAGHGGRGGWGGNPRAAGGTNYGSVSSPLCLGSGGAGGYQTSATNRLGCGYGGGALKIVATNTVTMQGTIAVNGEDGRSDLRAGGGSGGSIWIVCSTFAGNGTISANGGSASGGGANSGGGGGGGRIRIAWSTNSFSGTVIAKGGARGGQGGLTGHPGTYSFPNGQNMTIKGDVALAPGSYSIPYLLVTNNAALTMQGDTNTTDGSGVTLYCSTLVIASGSCISNNGEGFATQSGPGAGITTNPVGGGGGGGYGGAGGNGQDASALGGPTNGSATAPLSLGSGGGGGYSNAVSDHYGSSYGGGAVRLEVTKMFVLDGSIFADGENGQNDFRAGGASGGSIWIHSSSFTGSGSLSAKGGNASGGGAPKGGGGGGGRMLVECIILGFNTNNIAIAGGTGGGEGGQNGSPGSFTYRALSYPGTQIIIR